MSTRRVSIPDAGGDPFLAVVKQVLDRITGQHKNTPPLPALPETVTFAELRAAFNALLDRVQGSSDVQEPAALEATELGAVLTLIDAARFRAETANQRSAQALQLAARHAKAGFALRTQADGQTLDVVPEQLVRAIVPYLPRVATPPPAMGPNDTQHILANRIFGARRT